MAEKHEATATNWNGRELTVSFTARVRDPERLAAAAHEAFHREGKWTIRLDSIDGIEVEAKFAYK